MGHSEHEECICYVFSVQSYGDSCLQDIQLDQFFFSETRHSCNTVSTGFSGLSSFDLVLFYQKECELKTIKFDFVM